MFVKLGEQEIGSKKYTQYEREVISIPARGTINLIYKYRIHAHPVTKNSYHYKKALYYTFREEHGWMRKLFLLERTIILNMNNIDELNANSTLDCKIKKRLHNYINDRTISFKFKTGGEYKFYVLGESVELPKPVSLPGRNSHVYFTISEMYSGKDVIENSNKEIEMDKEEEVSVKIPLTEGNMIVIKVNKYERNPNAREECLKHYGYRCFVCNFNFEEYYGPIGKEIIEVHHLTRISESDETYVIDPIKDLRPICSNCHTMIHSRKNPMFRIEELRSIIKSRRLRI